MMTIIEAGRAPKRVRAGLVGRPRAKT